MSDKMRMSSRRLVKKYKIPKELLMKWEPLTKLRKKKLSEMSAAERAEYIKKYSAAAAKAAKGKRKRR